MLSHGKKATLSYLPYSSGLDLKTARAMLDAAEREAERLGTPMSIAIADGGGNLLAFYRMENAPLNSIQIAMDKAFTAVYGKIPTFSWKNEYTSGELVPLFFHERWIAFQGGFPLVKDNSIFGAIGVSGSRDTDCPVAKKGLEAGEFSTQDVDDAIRISRQEEDEDQ